MKERLELVRSFSELRAGMITVAKNCECGKSRCRAMLTELLPDQDGVSWDCLPECFVDGMQTAIGPDDVEAGTIYRVIDDLESPDEYHRSLSADDDLAKVRAHQRQKARAR